MSRHPPRATIETPATSPFIPGNLLRTGFRDLLRRPWQAGLMILGIALGVAVVVAIDLANASARRGFELSTQAVIGRASHHIVGGPGGVDEDLYRKLRVDFGFRNTAPVVEGLVTAPDLEGRPLKILGIDPLAEAPFRDYLAAGVVANPGFERFFTQPDTALISIGLAAEYFLQPGDKLDVQVDDRLASLHILGVLDPGEGNGEAAIEDIVLMDVASAQELLGLTGRLSRIDWIGEGKQLDRLQTSLPQGVFVRAASEQADTLTQLTAAFELNLTALSLLALVVGMFLIYNTTMFSVVQRRPVLGILRTLGVTRKQIITMIVLEALAVSLLGAVLGIALGWLLGQGAVRLVTQTINDLYFVVNVRQSLLTLTTVFKGLLLGLGAGSAAALVPAYEAASVAPVTSLQRSSLERRASARYVRTAWLGVGLLLTGAVLLLTTKSLLLSFSALLLIFLGLAAWVPAATVWAMRTARIIIVPWVGSTGSMASRTIVSALSRTSVAIAALMGALSVAIGVSLMIDSFRSTVVNWLDLTLRADLYISAPAVTGTRPLGNLDPTLVDRVFATPGVADIETIRSVEVDSEFGMVLLTAVDARRERDAALYRFARGSAREVWEAVQAGAVLVSEPFAFRNDLSPSQGELLLRTDRGLQRFPIAAVYYDYSSDRGSILMSREVYLRFWEDKAISSMAVFIEEGADLEKTTASIRQALANTGLEIRANRNLRAEALEIFERTFLITNALRILAVVVAFIGIVSALMALQLERSREFATLRALGLTVRGLWRLTMLETSLMGSLAGLLSIPAGFILALILIAIINLRSFGWTIQLQVDGWVFVQALGVGVIAAMLAAIYPALQLSRLPIAESLRQE